MSAKGFKFKYRTNKEVCRGPQSGLVEEKFKYWTKNILHYFFFTFFKYLPPAVRTE